MAEEGRVFVGCMPVFWHGCWDAVLRTKKSNRGFVLCYFMLGCVLFGDMFEELPLKYCD